MAIIKKSQMNAAVFSGISAVYAIKGGFVTSGSGGVTECDLTGSSVKLVELPVSDESGFSFTGGEPTINHFKVKGLNTDWASTFTAGDGSITLEVPTYHTEVLNLVYGKDAGKLNVKLPAELALENDVTVGGAAYTFNQTAVELGLLIINETGNKALFIKKVKFNAVPSFDGSEKPYCVTLNGTIAAASDDDAMAILEPTD